MLYCDLNVARKNKTTGGTVLFTGESKKRRECFFNNILLSNKRNKTLENAKQTDNGC